MKKLLLLALSVCFLEICSYSQSSTLELTFTAIDSAFYVQLDSIRVMNLTKGGDTILHWPDTTLVLYYVGIHQNFEENTNFQIQQNYPNPVIDKTSISICVPAKGNVKLRITDALGRNVSNTYWLLDKGCHEFSFCPGNANLYFFSAILEGTSRSIKMMNAAQGKSEQCSLEYKGKTANDLQTKSHRSIQDFFYAPGDELLYVAYKDTLQSGLSDTPETSDTLTLQFATNIPCPGIPNIEYDGQTYNTIQVCNQCWIKENLNVGLMINSTKAPSDNDTVEKYCMGNQGSSCDILGGLYYWNEMMQYINKTGGQGICPDGWHIPTDLDWQILEGTVDSEFGIGDSEWKSINWRGSNAGGNLKQMGNEYWESPNTGATDSYGFEVLPGGYFVEGFWGPGYKAYLWSSDNYQRYYRNMDWNQQRINRKSGVGNGIAFSVRCIKNQE